MNTSENELGSKCVIGDPNKACYLIVEGGTFGADYCNGTDVRWYLDDVEVNDCKAAASTASATSTRARPEYQ